MCIEQVPEKHIVAQCKYISINHNASITSFGIEYAQFKGIMNYSELDSNFQVLHYNSW